MIITKYYYSKAAHIRYLPVYTDAAGEVIAIKQNTVVNAKKNLPRITVASVYDTDTSTMSFGVSVCSPKDQFSKKAGRELAKERALSSKNKITGIRRGRIRETSRRHANELMSEYLKRYDGADI